MKQLFKFSLTLNNNNTGEKDVVTGIFEYEEWRCLENFLNYAQDLCCTKLVQSGMQSSIILKFNHNKGLTVKTTLPQWDDVIVFLHKFRPLGLKSENTNFYNVCKILSRTLQHNWMRIFIKEQRYLYSGKNMQSKFQIRLNDVLLNSEKVLNDWLNAYEYHRDKEKKKFIESLHKIIPLESSKGIFIYLLTDKAMAIFKIAQLIEVVFGRKKTFNVEIYKM